MIQDERGEFRTPPQGSAYPEKEEWNKKLNETYSFQVTRGENIAQEPKERLVSVHNRYKNTFSDLPGKAKNFVCELEFHNPIKFNKKSYPIAQSLKPAVRREIQKMLEQDIIETSSSPYTSPIVTVQKNCLLYTSRCV